MSECDDGSRRGTRTLSERTRRDRLTGPNSTHGSSITPVRRDPSDRCGGSARSAHSRAVTPLDVWIHSHLHARYDLVLGEPVPADLLTLVLESPAFGNDKTGEEQHDRSGEQTPQIEFPS